MLQAARSLLALSLLLCTVAGCYRMQTLRRQARRLDAFVRIDGRVRVPRAERHGPIVVLLLREPSDPAEPVAIVDQVQLFEPGEFHFRVMPDIYQLSAFVDVNENLLLDHDEPFTQPTHATTREPNLLRIDGSVRAPPRDEWAIRFIQSRNYRLGQVISLGDPLRGAASGSYGMWQPLRFIRRYVMGVYFLDEYDPARTPVLFIHGMGGFPQQFERYVELMDTRRYQPWFVHYPSGMPLEQVSEWLNRSLNELQTRFGFERLCVVAHSMGGIVAREVVNRHVENSGVPFLRGLITIAAPMNGLTSAEFGVDWSPSVAPSWKDLVEGSQMLSQLYRRPLPDYTRYDLLFTFHASSGSDTVVDIRSQLRPETQREAATVHGFESTHAAILQSRDAWDYIATSLDACAPRVPIVEDGDEITGHSVPSD